MEGFGDCFSTPVQPIPKRSSPASRESFAKRNFLHSWTRSGKRQFLFLRVILIEEADLIATRRNSSGRAYELQATETSHSTDSHRTWPGSKQFSRELLVHSFKTKQDFPSRMDSRSLTHQTAISPSEPKAIKTANV